MTYVISKPPTDDFTYPWFRDTIDKINGEVESYYMWSCHALIMDRFFQNVNCHAPLIIIGVKDLLDIWSTFNWWEDTQQSGTISIEGFVKRHPDTKIILFTSMENLDIELQQPNLHIIPWGGDWVNQQAGYSVLDPVLDKNFDSDRAFICLNRHVRPHRLMVLSYLFGTGSADHGVITYLKNPIGNPDVLLDCVNWQFGPTHSDIRNKILNGFELMKTQTNLDDDAYEIYHQYGKKTNDNIGNFDNRLRAMYRNSFVEIVTESSFIEPAFFITEKTAHAFYGCNFPIILGGVGIIAHLKDLGLDVFDDVVDHSYDLIENPFDRITTAIDSNRRLLTDLDYVKQSWIRCRLRFENNVRVIRTIHDWYAKRAEQQLAKTLELIS